MKKWFKMTLYGLGSLLVVGLIGRLIYSPPPASIGPLSGQSTREVTSRGLSKPDPKRDLVLQNVSWQTREDESVGIHSFDIYNGSKRYAYPAVTVRFCYYSDFGEKVGQFDKKVNRTVGIGQTVHIDKLKIGPLAQHADGVDMVILK